MSADTTPIAPGRFAAALKDLSIGMLHLKNLEIRNSIAHLQYSNDQLRPFAEGSATAVDDTASSSVADSSSTTAAAAGDQDCIDAIRENEAVIDRMCERIALIRAEVEERGVSWTEFQSKDEAEAAAEQQRQQSITGSAQESASTPAGAAAPATNFNGVQPNGAQPNGSGRHSAWEDGTFQTGVLRDGQAHVDRQAGRPQGGRLTDEELSRALQERMRDLEDDGDDEDGVHL